MNKNLKFFVLIQICLLLLLVAMSARAQSSNPPVVGRKAAQKYMGVSPADDATQQEAAVDRRPARAKASEPMGEHFLALHAGAFFDDDTYAWGQKTHGKDTGKWTMGVTYKMGEWVNSMDFLIRFDLIKYEVDGEKPMKLSFLPMIMFPDSYSKFPIYFGAGIGPGIFLKQSTDESVLSLDFQILAGVRFFNVTGSTGFFAEAGLKNHVFALSDGQFNGTFFALGTVFTF